MADDICEKCQHRIVIGAWPWCPHGLGANSVVGDEIDEWNENVSDHPVHFTSKQEKRRYLEEHGLMEFVRHVPRPDGRKPDTSRWI